MEEVVSNGATNGGESTKRKRKRSGKSNDDKDASVVVHRRYKMKAMPSNSAYGNNFEVKMEAVICPVVLHYNAETKEYTMDEEDHKVLNEYLIKYRCGKLVDSKVARPGSQRQRRQAAKKDRRQNSSKSKYYYFFFTISLDFFSNNDISSNKIFCNPNIIIPIKNFPVRVRCRKSQNTRKLSGAKMLLKRRKNNIKF